MAKYTKGKKLSLILIWIGITAIILTGAIFLLKQMRTSADDTVEESNYNSNLYVVSDGTTTTIYVSGKDYESATDITKQEDQCLTRSNPCYSVSSNATWDNPSIFASSNRPAWIFLNDAINQAPSGMPGDSEKITNVISAYITQAFDAWGALKLNGNEFTITSPELIRALDDNQISTINLPSEEITIDRANSIVKVKMLDNYPYAIKNSAWVKSTDFILGSALEPWDEAAKTFNFTHQKISEFRQTVLDHKDIYENSIRLQEQGAISGDTISLDYPKNIDLQHPGYANDFKIKINTAKFPLPAGKTDYNIKVYIKPFDKQSSASHIYLDNYSFQKGVEENGIIPYTFNWFSISNKAYSGGTDDFYYNFAYPQKYYFKVVLYNFDATSTVNKEITGDFSTLDTTWTNGDPVPPINSSILSIAAKPSAATRGVNVVATVTVTKPATVNVAAVVLYACAGSASSVLAGDSSSCTIKDSNGDNIPEPAIKGTWTNINFGADGKAKLTGSWTINSGTSIGRHALMVKAYAPDGTVITPADGNEDYIDSSKAATGIIVTNSTISTSGNSGTDSNFTGLFAGLFKTKASTLPRGSSIVSFGQLVQKIIKYSSGLIGVIAFFVILIAGFLYMTAGSNEAQTTKAKKAIIYALLGIAIYVLSYGIIYNVVHIITSITGGSSGGAMTPISLASLLTGEKTAFTLVTALAAAETLIGILTSFAATVGFVMIIWSSILYVTSVGDENKAETAKKTLIWSIAGTLIVTFAGFLVGLVDRFLA